MRDGSDVTRLFFCDGMLARAYHFDLRSMVLMAATNGFSFKQLKVWVKLVIANDTWYLLAHPESEE